MSFRVIRARVTLATALALTAALIAPAQPGVAAPVAAGADTIDVSGTVLVLAGEDGGRDRYSLLLPSGRTIELADGFTADPLSSFAGSVALPGASTGTGARLMGSLRASALRRAAASSTPLEVVDARVAEPAPSPGPTTHATYVAKVTNYGEIALPDTDILAQIGAAQGWWIGQSGGQVPAWNTVTGVTPVAANAGSTTDCGLGNDGASFGAIAADVGAQAYPGVDFSGRSPNHLVVVVPSGCGGTVASGRARLGASLASGGPVIIEARPAASFRTILEHEYGHNVSLQHSNNGTAEYGGLYEVMGSGPSVRPNPVLGTIYRMEEGILAPDEAVDGLAGGTWTLAPRSAAAGLRGVHFINPDDGLRYFVDYRDGSGADAGTCYVSGQCNYATGTYRQDYRPGLTIERENQRTGAFLLPAAGNDGSLQAGEAWTNVGGTLTVTATAANGVRINRTPGAPLGAGTAAVLTPVANREVAASATIPGATSIRYQWVLNGQGIPQADDATFTPTPDMVGGSLSVVATGYAVGREPSPPVQSPAQAVMPATWFTNGTTTYPVINGRARVGVKLTVTGLDWVDWFGQKPVGYTTTYAWTRNGKKIKGATGATYRVKASDRGKRIQVSEYPRAASFVTSAFARSSTTRKVRTGQLSSPRPTIRGKAKVGKRVVAKTKGWTRGTKFRYQWFVGTVALRGATSKKLRITRSMRGSKIKVKVTGTKKGFKRTSEKSRAVKVKK